MLRLFLLIHTGQSVEIGILRDDARETVHGESSYIKDFVEDDEREFYSNRSR